MTKVTNAQRVVALQYLRCYLNPGDIVYTILESVAESGMSRWIRVLYLSVGADGRPVVNHIDEAVARVLGLRCDYDQKGVQVKGAGMDMGVHIVSSLGEALWPNGTRKPHGFRNGKPDSSGGYALKHRWL